MLRLKTYSSIIILILFLGAGAGRHFVWAQASDSIKDSIEAKSQELQQINQQIEETQKNLGDVRAESRGLEREVKQRNYSINQLGLRIKAGTVSVEKLGLEINLLEEDIAITEERIESKREAVASLLQAMQVRDSEDILVTFLKNKALSDSISEIQRTADLNAELALGINDLRGLHAELSGDLSDVTDKKSVQERENFNLKNRRIIVEDEKRERQSLLASTKNQEKAYAEELSDLQKRQAEIAEEIEKLERELRTKIDPTLLPLPRPGVLLLSVSGRLSQGYGATEFALSGGYRGRYHNGIDIAAPVGTEIFAAESGEVVAAGDQDRYCPRGAYGKYIVVKHDNNLTTMYAHLSRQVVAAGARVERGQLIGYVGRTGYATGAHLHFTVWSSATYTVKVSRVCGPMPVGGDIDPMKYVTI